MTGTHLIGEEKLGILCDAAQRAGREVMDVYRTSFTSWQKDDATPLTEADLRSDRLIRTELERAFPGVFIWSEESSSEASAGTQPETFFLVDPLDGTREFLKRNDEFTVNIALVQGGEPVAGIVGAPALGELFVAARGLGAWKHTVSGRQRLDSAATPKTGPLRVMGSRSHGTEALATWLGQLEMPYTFVAAGSSLKFCRLAEGSADVYPRLGPTCQWDTAAGQAVLKCAGGVVLDAQGRELRYGLDRPVTNPSFIALARPGLELPPLQARP